MTAVMAVIAWSARGSGGRHWTQGYRGDLMARQDPPPTFLVRRGPWCGCVRTRKAKDNLLLAPRCPGGGSRGATAPRPTRGSDRGSQRGHIPPCTTPRRSRL